MTRGKDWLRSNAPVIYAVLVALALLIGLGAGLVLARWLWPPYPLEATPTGPTAPARPTTVGGVTATPLPGTPPAEGTAPSATATPCGPPPAGWVPYTVRPGDTLSELAERAGVSQERVMQVNCLDSPELLFGQPIYLPPLPTPTPCGPLPAGWLPYTVKPGDTLSGLAERAGVSPEQVTAANCLDSPELLAGQVIYLPPLPPPTPTPCVPAPPAGWVLYTVRPGDTLFSLAVTRDTTTAEVMRANCLDSAELWAGQGIYLPPIPSPYEAPTAPPAERTAEPTRAAVATQGVAVVDFPNLVMPPGGPNDPGFVPCEDWKNEPWIAVESAVKTNGLQHGQRAYFFACDFPQDPDINEPPMSARMVGPNDYAEQLDVLTFLLNPDLKWGQAQGMVVWNAIPCDLETGEYRLLFEDKKGNQASLAFQLKSLMHPIVQVWTQRILVVPQMGSAECSFEVYYCGYIDQAGEQIDVNFYREIAYSVDREQPTNNAHILDYTRGWSVTINNDGSAKQELRFLPTDAGGACMLRDRQDELKGEDMFWLIP